MHLPEDHLAVQRKYGYLFKKKKKGGTEAFNQLNAMKAFNLLVLETGHIF